MTSTFALATILSFLIFVAPVPGPAGEGLVAPDSLIVMADGSTEKAEDLVKGDNIRVWDDSNDVWTSRTVKSVVRNNSRSYWVLKTAESTLRGSANLWVAVSPAQILPMRSISSNATVWIPGPKGVLARPITGIREYPTNMALLNIDLETPGLFIASGVLVHD